jgi:uncharacterized protein
MRPIALRLTPGQDLKFELEALVKNEQVKSGCLLSAVGSLTDATLRLADGKTMKEFKGPFEIVSATGTVSPDGCHIHLSVADRKGSVIGGHLQQGCLVNTTAELVILSFEDLCFSRVFDPETGYEELKVSQQPS